MKQEVPKRIFPALVEDCTDQQLAEALGINLGMQNDLWHNTDKDSTIMKDLLFRQERGLIQERQIRGITKVNP
jgi:hypothetical protein